MINQALIVMVFLSSLKPHITTTFVPSHTFTEPTNHLLWDKEAEILVVVSKNTRTSFGKHLNVINVEIEGGSELYIKSKNDNKYANQVSAIFLTKEKVFIPCDAENKEFCMKYNSDPPSNTKKQVVPTTARKCLNETEWKVGELVGKENSYIKFERENTNVIFGFLRQDEKFIIGTQLLNGQQFQTTITQFFLNEEGRYSSLELILNCADDKQLAWDVATSGVFSNKIFSLVGFQSYIKKGEVLFMNFKGKGLNSGHQESALCVFPMAQIDDHMKEAATKQGSCGKSTIELWGEPLAFYNGEGTSLAVKTEYGNVVAFVGTSQGNLLKFKLRRHSLPSPLFNVSLLPYRETNKPTTSGIRKSNTFDDDEENLYLLFDNTVLGFPVTSCYFYETFKTCLEGLLSCGFCENKCTSRGQCTGKFVNNWAVYYRRISIALDSPTHGPFGGGTVLNLQINLSGIDEIPHDDQVEFTVGGITCKKMLTWERVNNNLNQEWSVKCKTGKSRSEHVAPVVMHILDPSTYKEITKISSSSSYFYLKPQLHGIHPGFGPQAGGTNITLYGRHLNIGSTRKVLLDTVTCDILKMNDEQIVCKAGPLNMSFAEVHKSSVSLWIDDNQFILTDPSPKALKREFEYRKNPVITQVFPQFSTLSGGTPIVVKGRHLNSAQSVVLSVTVNGIEKTEICTKTNEFGTEISCPTPALHPNAARPMELKPTQTRMSFRFDGVMESTFRDLYYYADPVLYKLTTILTAQEIVPELVLKGTNLNTTFKMSDVKITANNTDLCNGTVVTFSTLRCRVSTAVVEQLRDKGETYDINVRFGKMPYPEVGQINLSGSTSSSASSQNANGVNLLMSISVLLLVFVTMEL